MDLRRWHETIAAEFAMTVRTNPILSELHSGRGMTLGDLFNEGQEGALVVDNMNERPSLYYNKSAVGNRISLQLIGLKSNQAAWRPPMMRAVEVVKSYVFRHEPESRNGVVGGNAQRFWRVAAG